MTFLCRVSDLAATGARSVTFRNGADELNVVVADCDGVRHAFVNNCPHQNIPLETFPHHFFAKDKKHLVCSGHGAWFEADTGLCVKAPCNGDLRKLPIIETDGEVHLEPGVDVAAVVREEKSKRRW